MVLGLRLRLGLGLMLGLFLLLLLVLVLIMLLLLLLHIVLMLLDLPPVVLASTKQEIVRINSLGDQIAVLVNGTVLDESSTNDDVDRGEGLIVPCNEKK